MVVFLLKKYNIKIRQVYNSSTNAGGETETLMSIRKERFQRCGQCCPSDDSVC